MGTWADYDFDKEDAKAAVPLILLLLGVAFTTLRKEWRLAGVAVYYALYFFLTPGSNAIKKLFIRIHHWRTFRGPYCNSFCRGCKTFMATSRMTGISVTDVAKHPCM